MNREERILDHNKANVTKIVTKKPSNAEGSNGDINIGNTANGTSLFAKIKNKWYEFSSNESFSDRPTIIKGSMSIVHGCAISGGYGASTLAFLGMNGNDDVRQEITSALQMDHVMILPYPCRVISLTMRSEVYMGVTSVYLWSAQSGADILSSDTSLRGELSPITHRIHAGYAYTFTFSGEYKFLAGSSLAIELNANQLDETSLTTDLSWCLILDYDVPV